MLMSVILAAAALSLSQTVLAAPSNPALFKRAANSPVLNTNFPDPSILQDVDGTWYAYATTGNGKNIQAATAPAASGPWTLVNSDMLPDTGAWTTDSNSWAPDVQRLDNGGYVMYYSGQLASNPAFHCIGVATADNALGPFTPQAAPWTCPTDIGGAIDPTGFVDTDGSRWVVYKIDGNSIGHGGSCNNGVAPIQATPIMLQQVSPDDGFTYIGATTRILDRTDADGPLVEAPALVRSSDGTYVLFYSSGCFTQASYNVNYATASSITGPYTRSTTPLLVSGDQFGLTSPGGATPSADGSAIVFHANCAAGRCLYETKIAINGATVVISGRDGIFSE